MLSALEQRRARELTVQVGTLAENPTLKAAVDTYQAELGSANATFRREMLATIDRELEKLAARIGPDVLAVTDPSGTVLAVAGRRTARLAADPACGAARERSGSAYVSLPAGVFQFASAPLQLAGHGDRHAATRQGARRSLRAGTVDALRHGDAHRIRRPHHREHAPATSAPIADARRCCGPCHRARRSSSAGPDYAVKLLLPERRRDGLRARFDCRLDARADAGRSARRVLHRARIVRAGGVRQRLAGADDLASDRHAVDVTVRDDGRARLRSSGADRPASASRSTR